MSFVTTQPEALRAAATNLAGIGTTMSAQTYQAVSGQAEVIHQHLVSTTRTSATSYPVTEAAHAASAR